MLYKILNDNPRTLAERAYTPWIDMQRELALHGKLLLSLESARPLCDFDVVKSAGVGESSPPEQG